MGPRVFGMMARISSFGGWNLEFKVSRVSHPLHIPLLHDATERLDLTLWLSKNRLPAALAKLYSFNVSRKGKEIP
jgi:sRNA-binding protein